MPELYKHGELGLIVMNNCRTLGDKVCGHIVTIRGSQHDISEFEIPITQDRFSNGEGKVRLDDSVRGKDIYILSDIGNYSQTYKLYGEDHRMGPDEHFQDIKRVLSAIGGKASRISVIMPMLYSSRQHKRKGRESLDCAMALRELENLGVNAVLTFDAHDPTIHNAIPAASFENIFPTYNVIKAFIEAEGVKSLTENTIVMSPDVGAMDRAVYYGSVIGAEVGMFYKRRDRSKVVDGQCKVEKHEYVGRPLEGENILVVDDMIASGGSIVEVVESLQKQNVGDIFIAVTFGLFTSGPAKFDKLYAEGKMKRLFATNLTYIPEEIKNREWFVEVDVSEYIGLIVDTLNKDRSISPLLNSDEKIHNYIDAKLKEVQ